MLICRFLSLFGLQTSKHTKEVGALQKGADFVKAYALGFETNVGFATLATNLLRLIRRTGCHRATAPRRLIP